MIYFIVLISIGTVRILMFYASSNGEEKIDFKQCLNVYQYT